MSLIIDKFVSEATKLYTRKVSNEQKLLKTPENVREHRDVPYKNRNGKELLMDIYEPLNTEVPELPLVIYIHGGGLVLGDKMMSRGICLEMARRGFLVFTMNYRLAPSVSVYEQFDDVSAGMDFVGTKIIDFEVNPFRIYLAGDSAGAYLAIYTAALSKSKKMQEAIGHKPTRMAFKAMALFGGMFYTKKQDMIGKYLSTLFYRDAKKNKAMEPYLDPENKEVSGNLPPCLLITSEHDFLRQYSEKLVGYLWKHDIDYHFLYMGDDRKFTHVFPVLHSQDPESQKVIDVVKQWFDKY